MTDEFCVVCGVSLDLHPDDMDGQKACGVAVRKAELLENFARSTRQEPQ